MIMRSFTTIKMKMKFKEIDNASLTIKDLIKYKNKFKINIRC